MPRLAYTLPDIERWLGAREVDKGRAYLARVAGLDVRPGWIAARVQGTARHPYQVRVHLKNDGQAKMAMECTCSCPLGGWCKHVAATLLAALPKQVIGGPRPELLEWLEDFRRTVKPPVALKSASPKEVLLYALRPARYDDTWVVAFFKARRAAAGGYTGAESWNNVEGALAKPPRFVTDEDLSVLRLLWAQRFRSDTTVGAISIDGPHGEDVLTRLLATGRLFHAPESVSWGWKPEEPLAAAEARAGKLEWRVGDDGLLRPRLSVEGSPRDDGAQALPLGGAFWYVDAERHAVGPLRVEGDGSLMRRLLAVPPLERGEAPLLAAAMAELAPQLPAPDASLVDALETVEDPPRPVLTLGTLYGVYMQRYRNYPWGVTDFDYAVPSFHYGESCFPEGDNREFVSAADGRTLHIHRRPEEEAALLKALGGAGLTRAPRFGFDTYATAPAVAMYGLSSAEDWPVFMAEVLPELRALGWDIRIPAGFRHHRVIVDDWILEVEETDGGWFNLDLGVEVDGKRLPLAPLLADVFKRDARWLDKDAVRKIPDDASVVLETPDGIMISMRAERLKPLALTLIDLFDAPPADGSLRISRLDALRLADLDDRRQFKGMEAVQQMAERLRMSGGVQPVAPPAGLAVTLRPYQAQGLAWLQYLREQNLSGILADDMGLGKTAQALAHILMEKESGRLDRPVLAVMPTSLVHNWKNEAERFAPGLKVLALHGPGRKDLFDQIPAHDLVLTTYPLLWRDEEVLEAYEYHILLLDEAQSVKNAGSRSAAAVRRIRSRHRLCLTGTPLENHLGELWTQFDFLLPGFLGDSKEFTKRWRTPIEKRADNLRREVLAKRIRPFILRRRKEEVATELPPKTIILQSVDLEGRQRDLYETVRSAMDAKVREAVALKGFARSQIVILDALLKLRQVCCDPRLMKSMSAKPVKDSAKLDLLMDLLPEMVDEGRRILLFSQFTSMLDLIQAELKTKNIAFVRLDGDTSDRETPIKRFQKCEVPVFLISLKAGGVGLNLTAADTVIHYDPWWNPAVENQATDRAHRIGQEKPVFVYKLVVAGSIEEKILALQEKKAELAAGILSEDGGPAVKFSESDLSALLAPLPEAR